MSIERKDFDSEEELHSWVEKNIKTFFGDVNYLKGFQITTKRNKGGIPDGFIIDINNSSWTIIESELIRHGVWEHIAEQIIRFVVASQNFETKRKIRDKFFDEIKEKNLVNKISSKLGINPESLLRTIENIVETNTPDIAIFIDEINGDLEDMAESLNATIKIFKIQKYLANGSIEYLSPDKAQTAFETTIEDVKDIHGKPSIAVEALGGGKLLLKIGRANIFELDSGERITTKYSKAYPGPRSSWYWYAISPNMLSQYTQNNLTHIVFILGSDALIKLPMSILKDYLKLAKVTKKSDGTISHYHVTMSGRPEPMLYINQQERQWELDDYFTEL